MIVRNIHHGYLGAVAAPPDVGDRHCGVLHSWLEHLLKQSVADSAIARVPIDVSLSTVLVPIQSPPDSREFLEVVQEVVVE